MRNSRRTDIKGIFDKGNLRRGDLVPLRFEMWRVGMKFRHGKWRMRTEDYYTETRLYLPYTVYRYVGRLELQRIFISTGEMYAGHFWLAITDSLPTKAIDMVTGGIVAEHSIETFCGKHHLNRGNLERRMADMKAEFYRTLVRKGYIGKEYVK